VHLRFAEERSCEHATGNMRLMRNLKLKSKDKQQETKGYFGVFEMKTRIIEKGFLGEALTPVSGLSLGFIEDPNHP
jgi:hypothetical protein